MVTRSGDPGGNEYGDDRRMSIIRIIVLQLPFATMIKLTIGPYPSVITSLTAGNVAKSQRTSFERHIIIYG